MDLNHLTRWQKLGYGLALLLIVPPYLAWRTLGKLYRKLRG